MTLDRSVCYRQGMAGTTGETTYTEGNEEKVKFTQQSMTLTALKHGVRWSFLAELQITHDMRTTALNQLRKWLAGKIDDRIFAEFVGSGATTVPTTAKWFAGTATSIGTVDDTDAAGRLKLNDISERLLKKPSERSIEYSAVPGTAKVRPRLAPSS